ncbi:MAG: hypothetical protein JO159_20900 [Acidobacteria bacterium]|nr:hypothetical protein [Acidobacteriota bacterium]
MFLRTPGLKSACGGLVFSLLSLITLLSCGSSTRSSQPAHSGLAFRAFISNPVFPNVSGGGGPVIEIMDAAHDVLSASVIPVSSIANAVADAGLMAVSPKKDRTLMVSPADMKLVIINNAQESVSAAISLSGATESVLVASDNTTAFAAVPSLSVPGQSPGALERVDLSSASVTATIPVPGAHYIVSTPNGNQILVFSDNSNAVTLVIPSLIGTGSASSAPPPCSSSPVPACAITAPGLDRPVGAVVDGSGLTAYIMNCGPECGGSASAVSLLDLSPIAAGNPPVVTSTITVAAASTGLLQGNILYVAGTAPGQGCTPATGLCGTLSVIDLSSGPANVVCVPPSGSAMRACTVFPISDGFHNRVIMGANGQLFLGARNCTNLNTSSAVRGCLSIFNTATATVVIPPDNGDVTGIAAIPNRSVVYVCQGGNLRIYDTTTDKLATTPSPLPNIIGQAVDVKVVD